MWQGARSLRDGELDVSFASKCAVYTDPRHHSDAQNRGDKGQSCLSLAQTSLPHRSSDHRQEETDCISSPQRHVHHVALGCARVAQAWHGPPSVHVWGPRASASTRHTPDGAASRGEVDSVCRGPDQSRVRLYVTPAAQAASHPAVGFSSAEPCLYRTVTVTVTTRSRPFRAPGPGPASPPVPGPLTPKTRCPRSSRAPRQRHARQAPGRPPRLGPARFLPDVVPWTPPPFRPPHVAVLCTCDLFILKGPRVSEILRYLPQRHLAQRPPSGSAPSPQWRDFVLFVAG